MREMTLFEGIRTLRAVREFTDEPVSDEAIRAILDLAVCAPSGGNRQPWEFVVVRDPATRKNVLTPGPDPKLHRAAGQIRRRPRHRGRDAWRASRVQSGVLPSLRFPPASW